MKKICLLCLVFLILFVLASCSGKAAVSDTAEPVETTEAAVTAEPEITTSAEEYYESLKGKWMNADMKVTLPEGRVPVALTIDDGPNASMDKILDSLEEVGATATFFLIGRNVNDSTAETINRAVSLGCELGNHSWDHPDLVSLLEEKGEEAVIKQIRDTHDAIKAVTGIENFLIRPPYGSGNYEVMKATNAPYIAWSLDAADWDGATVEQAYRNVVGPVKEGDVILLHSNETTVESIKLIVPKLRELGFEPVTVSELAAYEGWDMISTEMYYNFKPTKRAQKGN